MQYRILGRTGLQVSEIGFGTWQLGGEWGQTDDEQSIRLLHRAMDLGVNFIDTALVYGNGHSEQVLGRALQGRRDKAIVATKIPPKNYRWPVTEADSINDTFPADWIVECTEKSLKNLQTDYVDVQQLHAWTPGYARQDEWYEALTRLQRDGKIRFFGVSSNDWDPDSPTEAVELGLLDTVQVIYNIFEQRPAARLLPAALQHGTGIIVRVPFEEGLLTGKMDENYQFEAGDWRAQWLSPERLREAKSRTDALKSFLNEDVPDLSALALKFCLSHRATATVIPGMRKLTHLEANVRVSDRKLLSGEEIESLKAHEFIHGWPYPWSGKSDLES
jgi:aryl-alcohol dehydrogenase-like predicted oxidoreductase